MIRFARIRWFGDWLLRWLLLAALWLALTDTDAAPELVAGAVAAALAASAAGLVSRPGRGRPARKTLELARLGPRRLARPLVELISGSAVLAHALWLQLARRRPVAGRFRVARYEPGPHRRSAAGRVITEAWGSLAANRYVVGVDDREGLILVHELVPRDDQAPDPFAPR